VPHPRATIVIRAPPARAHAAGRTARFAGLPALPAMDAYILGAVLMLAAWAWITFTTTAPGWVHLLLTAGVFLLIWRIVVRGTPAGPPDDAPRR
jgi:hypothetical protein